MRTVPASSFEWLSLALAAFKGYTVFAIFVLVVSGVVFDQRTAVFFDEGPLVNGGYFLSTVVFVVGGLVQIALGMRKSGLITLVFAAVSCIVSFCLLPVFLFD